MRLQVHDRLYCAAYESDIQWLNYKLASPAEFEGKADIELLELLGNELNIKAEITVGHEFEDFLVGKATLGLFSNIGLLLLQL